MNCVKVLSYQDDFFKGKLDTETRDTILSHIAICALCHQKYSEYAKKKGLVFDLIREIMKVCIEYKDADEKVNEIPECVSLIHTKRSRIESENAGPMPIIERTLTDKWTTASKLNDYSELMKVHAVRKIFMAKESPKAKSDAEYGEKYREFMNFLIKKICQRIDYFEKCLSLESEGRKDA